MALSCVFLAHGRVCPIRGENLSNQSPFSSTTALDCEQSLHRILSKLECYKQSPLAALQSGRWVKLICGASFEDIAEVRNLSLIYALAGVDCIDCAADGAVVTAVSDGVRAAKEIALDFGYSLRDPWLMVSINDDEDPHFRKAEFNPRLCPSDCPRPCERVCPASAISVSYPESSGVIPERCYGCGRCIPVCPIRNIQAVTYVRNLEKVSELLCLDEVDAVEIHTGQGRLEAFHQLVTNLGSSFDHLKLVAVSVPDLGDSMISSMTSMYESMKPYVKCANLWQLDGRPMSGDIGKGATRAAVILGGRVLAALDRPPGFLQLAGGTNSHTREALELDGLVNNGNESMIAGIAGIAFGGYARKIVCGLLKELEATKSTRLEDHPELLFKSISITGELVWPMKL
ncbi:uncharacterized protein LOC9642427 [Selaginella moellendorffii]|uniref:uncharacterized protein LOC9642427 n=1 Tax=Selaginella moellendorffii TaxID=88036 RepID=UPI000D1C9108|nr:uncharacterized protein LOC9642427 [Selaginella moellendorffii]|eukprot:XP_024534307.1 uncharacterized protein LOC9642427 [Selaginella moellendorffii]